MHLKKSDCRSVLLGIFAFCGAEKRAGIFRVELTLWNLWISSLGEGHKPRDMVSKACLREIWLFTNNWRLRIFLRPKKTSIYHYTFYYQIERGLWMLNRNDNLFRMRFSVFGDCLVKKHIY